MRCLGLLGLLGLLTLALACSDDEERRRSLIDNPRILAIAAEPPLLGPGQVSSLEALVVDRSGTVTSAEVSWRACAPWTVVLDPNVQCGQDSSMALPAGELRAPSELDELVEVPIVAEALVDGTRLVAVKRIRIDPEAPPDSPMLAVQSVHLDGAEPAQIEAGREYRVDVDLVGVFPDAEGSSDATLTFYANAGEFADESVEISFEREQPEQRASTSWIAPMNTEGIAFWLVATGPSNTTSWLQIPAK